MPMFTYKFKRQSGRTKEGQLRAENKYEAVAILYEESYPDLPAERIYDSVTETPAP